MAPSRVIRLAAMLRILLLALPILFAACGARAQSPAAAPPAAAAPALAPAQAQQVLDVLRDPAKRAQFESVLEDMAKALPAAPAAAPAATPAKPPATPAAAPAAPAAAAALPIPLAPDSLGADVLVGVSNRLAALTAEVSDSARVLTNFPLLFRFVEHLVRSPHARQQLLGSAWRLALVMLIAVGAERLSVRLLRPALVRLAEHGPMPAPAPDQPPPRRGHRGRAAAANGGKQRLRPTALLLLRRLPFLLARFALEMVPIVVLAAIGYALLGTPLGADRVARLANLAVLNAYLLTRLLVTVARVLLAPDAPRLRVVRLSDATAIYLTRWTRRIAIIAIFGYALAELGLLFGMYRVAHDALLRLVVLAVHLSLVVMVLQTRRRVAELIRARPDATGPMAVLRNRLAAVWHIIAIFYIVALWLVWAFEVQDGFERLLRVFVSTVVVLAVARLVSVSAHGALDRAVQIQADVAARYPGLEARARAYQPAAHASLTAIITVVAVVVLFQGWGIDSFAWFSAGQLGGRVVSALIGIGFTLLCALVVWESANAVLQRRLSRLSRDAQAARARTLMPLLRSLLLVSICLVAGLIVLSDIGVNIAPLLAGAGVVGIAIGFGSQKLVQDVITGLFLLLENAMHVGDWVTVSGLSGTVEQLSIRTIRLRAGDGSIHIIPFSSVTSVTNVNRGIGNASVSVSVAFGEDVARVCAVLTAIADEMRTDRDFAPSMKTELQLWGVDKVEAGGVTIVGQIVCSDAGRWNVQREFNRRMQLRFAELGIKLAMPVQRLTVEQLEAPAPQAEAPAKPPVRPQPQPEREAVAPRF